MLQLRMVVKTTKVTAKFAIQPSLSDRRSPASGTGIQREGRQ
jgi:hypothetical protein